MQVQSVNGKNGVLCDGIYNYFTMKYGTNEKRKASKHVIRRSKSHNRPMKRVTLEKNKARRELRAAKREGKEEGVIKEIARKFHKLIRLHSRAKKEQLRA